jgi:hypothetical protein
MMKGRLPRIILILVIIGWSFKAWAAPKTIALPMTLDFPLVRAALMSQMYTQEGQKAILSDRSNRCLRIELSDPSIRADGASILLFNRLTLQAGFELNGSCLQPLIWEGYVELRLKPYLEQKAWLLRFKTQGSNFYNLEKEKMPVAEAVWKLIEKYVHPPLGRVTLDLAPPINEVTQLLPLFVKPEDVEKVKTGLRSLRPGPVRIAPAAVEAELLLDLEFPEGLPSDSRPAPLSDVEKARFIKAWEIWDSFLVHELLSLVGRPLTEEEKGALLKTLLETRHGFLEALKHPNPKQDLVREQFIKSWSQLGPIFKKHRTREDGPALFRSMGYFTAMDALKILDQLGPAFGLEINRNGLIRLARLLSQESVSWTPGYSAQVDPELRRLLGFGSPIDERGPQYEADELDLPNPVIENNSSGREILRPFRWIPISSKDEEVPLADRDLLKWIPDETNIDDYLQRVEKVLSGASEQVLAQKSLGENQADLFKNLVSATAWQESCWRQLTASNGKIRFLRSYNGSSVGLMQINVRVWRGLYEPRSLRWNIHYNVRAGTEILEHYLSRYILDRLGPEPLLPPELLSGAVYAMYNGGPAQFERFLKRNQDGRPNTYDRYFREKYDWVKNGRWERLQWCLTGKES